MINLLNIFVGFSCWCTCPFAWTAPPAWSGTGPVAIIDFDDTWSFIFHGGLECQMKVPGHVSKVNSNPSNLI